MNSEQMAQGRRAAPGGRFPFIDVLRGLAVVFMIETHTLNALLHPALRRGAFYSAVMYLNGLVAPAFLFCAGLGFAIFLSRKNDEVVALGGAFRSYLKKCLFIVLLGYSLHVPVFSLRGMIAAAPSFRDGVLQVDILQVIGVTLAGLLVVAVLARSPRSRIAAALSLTAAALLWGYLFPGGDPGGGLPAWLLAYFSRILSPLFTIVPWAGFLTAGFVSGSFYADCASGGREAYAVRLFTIVSASLLAAAPLVSIFTKGLYGGEDFWYWSAEYFLVRLGSVGLVMCALWFLLREGEGPVSRVLVVFGRESLPVYYFHLIIVYGRDFEWSFIRLFPGGGGYALCAVLAGGLIAAMYLFGRSWGSIKKNHPRAAWFSVRALVAGSMLTFLIA
jgi:uncharacterized membrane protein